MRIKLLIATGDTDYADHLSALLSEQYADTFDVCVSRTPERLHELLENAGFDVALLEPAWVPEISLSMITLPMILWEKDGDDEGMPEQLGKVYKYRRVSSIVSGVLEQYARVTADARGCDAGRARITAVWSPAGGVGTSTVALAYAAGKASAGKQAFYLNLESFSSVPIYFPETGKSISVVFEMLENHDGNVSTLIRGIRKQDAESHISYFCRPDNFDDINILTAENVSALIAACAAASDELIIDLSCVCDERTRRVFESADRVLLVTDPSGTAQLKLSQFVFQNDVFKRIRSKTTLVANRNAAANGLPVDSAIRLPFIQSANAVTVYKALAGSIPEA